MFALTLPYRLQNFCSAIRETLGQRQIRQSPGLALNAHSGNEWGKIPVLTGLCVFSDYLYEKIISDITTFVGFLFSTSPRAYFKFAAMTSGSLIFINRKSIYAYQKIFPLIQPLFPLRKDYFHQNNIDLHVEIIHCIQAI